MSAPVSLLNEQIRHYSKQEFARVFNNVLGSRLSGRPAQGVHEESLLQNYVIGSRRIEGLTIYHYAKMLAGFSIANAQQRRGVVNSIAQNISTLAAAAAVGAMQVSVVDAVAVAHQYQNGKIVIETAAAFQHIDIVDNAASDGVNTLLTLATPILILAALGTVTSIYPNIYSAVRAPSGDGYETFVGVPQRLVTAGYYFWLPTWGLVGMTPAALWGGAIEERQAIFDVADGSAEFIDGDYLAGNRHRQILGYLSQHTSLGSGDSMFWLMLDP